MREQLEQRLTELKNEFEAGQRVMAELEAKHSGLRETLLRISGAIQVLQEQLSMAERSSSGVDSTVDAAPETNTKLQETSGSDTAVAG